MPGNWQIHAAIDAALAVLFWLLVCVGLAVRRRVLALEIEQGLMQRKSEVAAGALDLRLEAAEKHLRPQAVPSSALPARQSRGALQLPIKVRALDQGRFASSDQAVLAKLLGRHPRRTQNQV